MKKKIALFDKKLIPVPLDYAILRKIRPKQKDPRDASHIIPYFQLQYSGVVFFFLFLANEWMDL